MTTPNIQSVFGTPVRRLVVAAVAGTLAVGLLSYYIETTLHERSGGDRIPILVATRAVSPGERIEGDGIAVQEVPRAYLHANAIASEDQGKVTGRRVYRQIVDHQPLLWTDFDPPDSDRASLTGLGKGMRAIPVLMGEALQKAHMLRSGDSVDVLAHFELPQGNVAVTLFQRVLVLDQRDEVVVLSVTPEQAERFAFAQAHGQITLAARNRDDTEQRDLDQVSFTNVLRGFVDERQASAAGGAGGSKVPPQLLQMLEAARPQKDK